MFILSKGIEYLILPPGLFIILLLISLILLYKQRRKTGEILLIASIGLIYLFSTPLLAGILLHPLERAYPALVPSELRPAAGQEQEVDQVDADSPCSGKVNAGVAGAEYIVCLGGGVIEDSPEAGAFGVTLSPQALKRLVHARLLHESTGLPIILAGGKPLMGEETPSEAETAGERLLGLGMDGSDILLETKSRTTWENAYNVAKGHSPEKVILVSSAYHMPRSVFSFEKNGMVPIPAPSDYRSSSAGLKFTDFLPSLGGLKNTYLAIHEYIGYLYYHIRY